MFIKSIITGTASSYYLLNLRKNQWKSLEELKGIQFKKLKSIIKYAYNYVPYYHELFKSVKFEPDNLRNIDDLKKLPTITKKDIQKNYPYIISKEIDEKYIISYTSGSTGIPLKIIKDKKAFYYSIALMGYACMECGLRLRDKFVKIGRFNTFNYLPNQITIPSPTESKNFADTINYLRQIKPDSIYTIPSILDSLCTFDVLGVDPRLIFSHGLTLTKPTRYLVESTFETKINNLYGSAEFNRLAFECNEHSGLHMITDCALIEFLDDGESVSPGETGEIVVTGLYNYAMPLIRYKLGDLGVPTDESCNCGRNWPLIKDIEGRTIDIFTLKSGRKIYPHFIYQFFNDVIKKNVFCISQFQIIQEKRNKIVLKIVKGKEFKINIIILLKEKFKKAFADIGENVEVEVHIVSEIPLEKSGKRKIMISQLD